MPLGARAFDVLLWLLRHPDQLVTKQELMEQVWPGLVVEENNLSVQVSSLRKVLGPASIATVPGRGYRFAAALTELEPPETQIHQVSERPGIAVLPFAVLSSDPTEALLGDGLVADVIALLARVPGFLLISRASSFAFREQQAAPGEIAKKLGVRYFVEGNLRVIGTRVHASMRPLGTCCGAGSSTWLAKQRRTFRRGLRAASSRSCSPNSPERKSR